MKNAVITGASTGIGRHTAIQLADSGYHVVLVARREDRLKQTAEQVEKIGGTVTVLPTDLSDLDAVKQLINTICKTFHTIDALINVAGIWHGKDTVFADTDFQDFDVQTIADTYTVGFTAPTVLVHGLLPKMGKNAKIVNVTGTFENGAKGWLPYYASKRALEDFTVGLSEELKDKTIQVNAVSPSDTATEEYEKYFPQYSSDAINPESVVRQILAFCGNDNVTTGKVIVIKKDTLPFEAFHY